VLWHRDIIPTGKDLEETNRHLDVITDYVLTLQNETGIRPLWVTCNLFSHARCILYCFSFYFDVMLPITRYYYCWICDPSMSVSVSIFTFTFSVCRVFIVMFDYYKTVIWAASLIRLAVGFSGSPLSCLLTILALLFNFRWQINMI